MSIKCSCVSCKSEINTSNLSRHVNSTSCLNGGKYCRTVWICPEDLKCPFCREEYSNSRNLANHVRQCHSNPNRKPRSERQEATRPKLENYWKSDVALKKQKHSVSMKKAVEENPNQYNASNRGRCKVIEKHGQKFIGQWEVDFYEWCLNNNVPCIRPNIGFPYSLNGNQHTYFPDFYLPLHEVWVEVKGYKTEKDIAKWNNFPLQLVVIEKNEIKQIRNGSFHLNMVGPGRIELPT